MEKVILVRFGEIFLKGKNRGFFEKVLVSNIKTALEKCKINKVVEKLYVNQFETQ